MGQTVLEREVNYMYAYDGVGGGGVGGYIERLWLEVGT